MPLPTLNCVASMESITYINGTRLALPPGRGEATLLQFLREKGFTGSKLGCGEGGCGACTVMVSHWESGKVVHRSVNACLCPLYAVEGMHVVTSEGIGNIRDGLHPVQSVLARSHGSQCGFCTPGFVMSMYALLRSSDEPPAMEEVEDALGGNLWGAANVCPSSGLPCDCKSSGGGCGAGAAGCGKAGCTSAKAPPGEPIFPPELKSREPFSIAPAGPSQTDTRPARPHGRAP
eukprot:gene22195-29255_t